MVCPVLVCAQTYDVYDDESRDSVGRYHYTDAEAAEGSRAELAYAHASHARAARRVGCAKSISYLLRSDRRPEAILRLRFDHRRTQRGRRSLQLQLRDSSDASSIPDSRSRSHGSY